MGIYYINRLITRGPQDSTPVSSEPATPERQLSVALASGRKVLVEAGT
jgi:hypothetical protein